MVALITSLPASNQSDILTNIKLSLEGSLEQAAHAPGFMDAAFRGYLLSFVLRQTELVKVVIKSHQPHSFIQTNYCIPWNALWRIVTPALNECFARHSQEDLSHAAGLAKECLENIDEVDEQWLPDSDPDDFDTWARTFNPAESFFSDELIEAVYHFAPGDLIEGRGIGIGSRRIRRFLLLKDGDPTWSLSANTATSIRQSLSLGSSYVDDQSQRLSPTDSSEYRLSEPPDEVLARLPDQSLSSPHGDNTD